MQITLKQREIEAAVRQSIAAKFNGIVPGNFAVTFTAGRGPEGLTATIDLDDDDSGKAPSASAPAADASASASASTAATKPALSVVTPQPVAAPSLPQPLAQPSVASLVGAESSKSQPLSALFSGPSGGEGTLAASFAEPAVADNAVLAEGKTDDLPVVPPAKPGVSLFS